MIGLFTHLRQYSVPAGQDVVTGSKAWRSLEATMLTMLSSHEKTPIEKGNQIPNSPYSTGTERKLACFRPAAFDSQLIKRYDHGTSAINTSYYTKQVDKDVQGNSYYMNRTAGQVFKAGDFRNQKHR